MLKSLYFPLVFSIVALTSFAQELRFYQINEFNEYEQVLVQSVQDEKMIYAVVYENNGDFERMVREDVFDNDSLAAYYNENTLPIAIDINSNMGARMAETFGIEELPIFYYFTDEELLVLIRSGYQNTEALLTGLEDALEKRSSYKNLQQKYLDHSLTPDEWTKLLDIYSLNFNYVQTMERALEFFAGLDNTQLMSDKVRPVLLQYGLDLETRYPEFIIKNKDKLDSAAFASYYASAYSYNFDRAVANQDSVLLEKIVQTLIPVTPNPDTTLEKLAFETKKVFAADARVFHVWRDAALEVAKSEENDSLRALFIFEEAFEIADNFNSEDAQKAAMQMAHHANEIDEEFRYKMLEGYMAYLLKDYEKAEKLVNEAGLLSDQPQNQSKAQGLMRMIEKGKKDAQKEEAANEQE